MGCFDSTCAMTRLPIHSDDDIVYIEYRNIWLGGKRDMEASTCNFLQYTYYAYKLPKNEIESIRHAQEYYAQRFPDLRDKLEEYIAESIAEKQKLAKSKILVVHGKYNDYGGIGDRWQGQEVFPPDDIRMDNLYFFIHEAVWEAYKGEDDYETLYNINRAAYDARIELFDGNHSLGQQYSGSEYVTERRKILDIAEALLPTLYCSNDGEDEE